MSYEVAARPILDPKLLTDPNNADSIVKTIKGSKAIPELPPEIRAFKYVIDVSDLCVGDAILFSPLRPTYTSRQIRSLQTSRVGLASDHCEWTHVAMYLHSRMILEANPWSGVCLRSIYDYSPTHKILIRRVKNIDLAERYEMAIRGLTRLGSNYHLSKVPGIVLSAVIGRWKPGAHTGRDLITCSNLFSECFAEVRQTPLISGNFRDVWPGHLSEEKSNLEDVAVGWVEIQNS